MVFREIDRFRGLGEYDNKTGSAQIAKRLDRSAVETTFVGHATRHSSVFLVPFSRKTEAARKSAGLFEKQA
jgi:hypothetical protein